METLAPPAGRSRTTPPAPQPGAGQHPELRGLIALLAVDVLAGTWLSLHTAWGPSLFLAHVPVIGFAGVAWSLFPDASKAHVRARVVEQLGRPGFVRGLGVVAALGTAVTLVRGGVVLSAVEPNSATTIHVVRGSQLRPDSAAQARALTLRLNRLTSPARATMWIPPFGAPVWLHTATHVSAQDHRAWPWAPVRVQYPDDFVPMITLPALPDPAVFGKLTHHDRVLVVRDAAPDGPVVARDTLDIRGRLLAFTEPGPLDATDSVRWAAHLRQRRPGASDAARAQTLKEWTEARWVRAVRPLRIGDVLHWEVRSTGDSVLGRGRLELSSAEVVLDVAF